MVHTFDKKAFKKQIKENVKLLYRKEFEEANNQEIYQAVALAVKDEVIDNWLATQKTMEKEDPKTVFYMSMEFLMGRALGNNMMRFQSAWMSLALILMQLRMRNQTQHWEMVDWADLLPALWTRCLHSDTQPMAAVSVTVMVCLNKRLKTATRKKYRITG